jgi:hypothetical protein
MKYLGAKSGARIAIGTAEAFPTNREISSETYRAPTVPFTQVIGKFIG